jgi:Domain of unknown function (DUF4403)
MLSRLRLQAWLRVALATVLAACSRHFEVPSPAQPLPGSALSSVPAAEPATIVIPIVISMTGLRARMDSVLPATDSLDRAKCSAIGGLVCHQYVYRRDSLDLTMRGDRVALFTALRFRGRVALPGVGGVASCGYEPEPMRRAELRLATTLYWRTDWRLASRATSLAPEILDPCEVTVLHVDATPTMKRILDGQLAYLKQQFDSIVPAVADLKPAADSIWRAMLRPLAIDSASTVWFAMSPDAVSLAPLIGNGGVVGTAIALTGHPRVVIGARPSTDARPLPSLTLAGKTNGIHVPLDIEIPFDELGRRATALLSGEVAGKGMRVGQIAAWGVGDTVVVKVDVDGRVSGSLYLVGKIGYDVATRSVLIGDMRYTLESSSKMSSIKATLGASRIRNALADATGNGRLAVGDQVERLKAQLGELLNRPIAPGVVLTGGVTDVRIERLFSTPTAFVLRVVLDAAARIDVR